MFLCEIQILQPRSSFAARKSPAFPSDLQLYIVSSRHGLVTFAPDFGTKDLEFKTPEKLPLVIVWMGI